jgi:hypothetical protein
MDVIADFQKAIKAFIHASFSGFKSDSPLLLSTSENVITLIKEICARTFSPPTPCLKSVRSNTINQWQKDLTEQLFGDFT